MNKKLSKKVIRKIFSIICTITISTTMVVYTPNSYAEENVNTVCSIDMKKLYLDEDNKYYAVNISNPAVIFNSTNPPRDDKGNINIDGAVKESVEIHSTPDYKNKTINWRLYYNPGGNEWQKPVVWFSFQDNVNIVGDIKIKGYWSSKILDKSIPVQPLMTISAENWPTTWSNPAGTVYISDFLKGRLSSEPGRLNRVGWNAVNLGRYLVKDYEYKFNPGKGYPMKPVGIYPIVFDYATNSINGINVGDLYMFSGTSSSLQASSGVSVSYFIDITTTMPTDTSKDINVFGGMVSFQQNELLYRNIQHTLKAKSLNDVVYSQKIDKPKYVREQLPSTNQYMDLYSKVNSNNIDDKKKRLLEWIMYLGYPYDNSGYSSNYIEAATKPVAEEEFSNIIKFTSQIDINDQYNPIRDYYKGTQQAIWNVLYGTEFEPATYKYTENGVEKNNSYNGGEDLLNLAKQKLENEGSLEDYLKKISGKKDLKTYLYGDREVSLDSKSEIDNGYLKLEPSCKYMEDKLTIGVDNVDQDGNNLSNSTFSLYEGALSEKELQDNKPVITDLKSVNGRLSLTDISTNKYYTLVQNTSPGVMYTKAKPIIFYAHPSYNIDLIKGDASVNHGLNYESFDRMDNKLSNYRIDKYDKKPRVVDSKPFETKDVSISDISKPIENAIKMVNIKMDFKPGITGYVSVLGKDGLVDLDDTSKNKSITVNITKPKEEQRVKAVIYYKGLNFTKNYKIKAQLYDSNDNPVGDEYIGDLSSEYLKTHTDSVAVNKIIKENNITAKDLEKINSFSKDKFVQIDLGKRPLDNGKYYIKYSITPNKEGDQINNILESGKDNLANNFEVTVSEDIPWVGLKYRVKYKYESSTEGKDLPSDLLIEYPLPNDSRLYDNDTEVRPSGNIDVGSEYKVDGGYWKFEGWTPASVKINNVNAEFTGRWKFVETVPWTDIEYKVYYKYESSTPGKKLPSGIEEEYKLPKDGNTYKNKTEVLASDSVKVGSKYKVDGGYWKFEGWTPAIVKINNANAEFTGRWKFVKTVPWTDIEYKVYYKYESSTPGKKLPSGIEEEYKLPKDDKVYKNNTEVLASDSVKVGSEYKVDGGCWKFEGWTPDSIKINNANAEFVGRWKFVEDKETVDPDKKPDPETKPDDSDRISGKDSSETASDVSKHVYPSGTDIVLLVNKEKFPDVLTSMPYGKTLKAPILYTNFNNLPKSTADELVRLKSKKIILIGGERSISKDQRNLLVSKGYSVDRVGGSDRYQTAELIAYKVKNETKKNSKDVIIASGELFPDALSISPLALREEIPILLSKKNDLTRSTEEGLQKLSKGRIYISGGYNTLSKFIDTKLKRYTSKSLTRYAGIDRYMTSTVIAKAVVPNSKTAIIASGEVFQDALVSGSLVDKYNAPLILVRKKEVPTSVKDYLRTSQIEKNIIVGGRNTVSLEVEKILNNIINKK